MNNIVFKSNSLLNPWEILGKMIRLFQTSDVSAEKLQQINNVELIGTIHKHLFTLPSGNKSCVVHTIEPNNKNYYHLVGTRTPLKYEIGQRVHLVGRLSSQNFWSEEQKLKQKIIIKAFEFELLSDEDDQSDKNQVQLQSQIYSNIEHLTNSSLFTISTQHYTKGGRAAGIYNTENHRIIIRDPSLLEFSRKELKQLDWVRIDGKICYSYSKNGKNETRTSGYILPNKIIKINTKQ